MSLLAIFLAISLPLYAAMHAYVYRKLTRAFPQPRVLKPLLVSAFFLLFAAPFVGRVFDHDGHVWVARVINLPAYLWAAWVFWFCIAGLLLDLGALLARAIHRLVPGCHTGTAFPTPQALSGTRQARRQLATIAILLVLATVWGAVEASYPRIRSLTFVARGLPRGSAPLRIVQISDVHLSVFRGPRWSRYLAGRVAALKPEVLLSTGDLIDSSVLNIGDQADDWASILPPFGKYAVLGNHDYYTGLANAEEFHRRAGFHLLRGKGVDIGTGLRLYGVDDATGIHMQVPCFSDESALRTFGTPDRFMVLLKHQPFIAPVSLDHYDLQLSGHTHGGQIFPFHVLVRLLYPLNSGLRRVGTRSHLYVNHGAGTWGPPLRLFAPPEITVITLTPNAP